MKEATGEGSLSVITIVIIVGIAAAAIALVVFIMGQAENRSEDIGHFCSAGYHWDDTSNTCVLD